MDKYEYNVKSDQIKKLYSRKEFEAAAKLADEIDWYRVKDNTMLNRVADIYENVKQYDKAKEVLLIAYERSPLGRQLAYRLTILSIRTKNFVEADEFYQDFVEMSPSDVSQYLLKYRIAKAKGEDIEVLIKILEAYVDVEMDERWQYELAKLYHEAGMDDKCIAMCDEVELWFNDGKYVDKAKELRQLITGMLNEYKNRHAETEDKVSDEDNESSGQKNYAYNFNTDFNIEKETEEEIMANEALKAAEAAALKAQRAADMAKQLVREARLKAEQVKSSEKSESGIYKKMSAEEISQSLEEEETLKSSKDINKKDTMIEIFEFDKNKEGKGNNIGEELTKTAEIDIDQINVKLADTDNIYNTANIQAALAKSMEKLMKAEKKKARNAFATQIDENEEEIKVVEATEVNRVNAETPKQAKKAKVKPEVKEEVPNQVEKAKVKPEVKEEAPKQMEKVEVNAEVSEPVRKPEEKAEIPEPIKKQKDTPASVKEEEYKESFSDEEFAGEPTKRVDRDEINRILNVSKMISKSLNESSSKSNEDSKVEQEEQIKGQMTIEEMIAGYEEPEPEEEDLNDIEPEGDMSVSEESAVEIEDNTSNISDSQEEASDVKNTHTIPEEYRSLFNDFVGAKSMEEVIACTLDNLINNFVMDGTSGTNNIIITGSAKIGKTTLGLSLIKAANRGRNRGGRKVAKVKASALNKRGVALAMTQILGTDLIIEQAGNLMPNTIVDLMIAMKNYTEEMLIVLEDDEVAIDRLLDNAPELKEFFTNRLDIREMEINDMVKIAKEYAAQQLYSIDEIGELALYVKLDDISGKNPVISIEDIEEVIDEAIEHANRFSIGKMFGKLRKNKSETRILTEQDFL